MSISSHHSTQKNQLLHRIANYAFISLCYVCTVVYRKKTTHKRLHVYIYTRFVFYLLMKFVIE